MALPPGRSGVAPAAVVCPGKVIGLTWPVGEWPGPGRGCARPNPPWLGVRSPSGVASGGSRASGRRPPRLGLCCRLAHPGRRGRRPPKHLRVVVRYNSGIASHRQALEETPWGHGVVSARLATVPTFGRGAALFERMVARTLGSWKPPPHHHTGRVRVPVSTTSGTGGELASCLWRC